MNQDALNNLTNAQKALLLSLYSRAAEQHRDQPIINDPVADQCIRDTQFDFRKLLGRPNPLHTIRASVCDDYIKHYVNHCEAPLIINLGEALETQPWRFTNTEIQWITVDNPEAIKFRNQVLPEHPQVKTIACDVLDEQWLKAIPKVKDPFVSASNLLMLQSPQEVKSLLATICDYFPEATIFFDTIPPALLHKKMKELRLSRQKHRYDMSWGMGINDLSKFLNSIPGITLDSALSYADPYPLRTPFYSWLLKSDFLCQKLAGSLVLARATKKTAAYYEKQAIPLISNLAYSPS